MKLLKPLYLVLISMPSALAQNTTTFSVPSRRIFRFSPNSPQLLLEFPAFNNPYYLTIAVCGAVLPLPQFFVSNETGVNLPGPGGAPGSQGGQELSLDDGLITYYTESRDGGVLAVWPNAQAKANWTIDVATSERGPVHQRMTQLPLLGDTSSTRAIIFSPPFLAPNFTEPSYPNYTLQSAIPDIPAAPPTPPAPNTTLLIFPTANANETVWLTNSACALASKLGGALVNTVSRTLLRDSDGWRTQWFVDGLSPSTNYSAYVIEDGVKVSGPSYLLTKSNNFPCPLVHSLPYCPAVTYAVPLPGPPNGATSYTDQNLPQDIRDTVISSLSNFTSSLKTFACGRDWYSPLQTCTGCQNAYRKWVCSIVFPRCGEPIPDSALEAPQLAFNDPNSNRRPDIPLPQAALVTRNANAAPRSPFLPSLNVEYQELLPCIETCNIVDRSCPPLLKWKCPSVEVNADVSYGLGFIDSWDGRTERGGRPGVAQDEFGRVWCNA
ncbi:stretch-activated cation channel MID1 [Ceratobasidium sp. AG-Ba]|nr:stretch-activated cation channel MID1 [Ceratobasidium sp. AG-Ba]